MIRAIRGAASPPTQGLGAAFVPAGASTLPPNSLNSQQLRCTKARQGPPTSAGRLEPSPSASQELDLRPYPC